MLPGLERRYAYFQLKFANRSQPHVKSVSVPPGARSALVTLHSTTRHSRYGTLGPLQMKLSADPDDNLAQAVEDEMKSFGSFLVRTIDGLKDGDKLRIGVGPFKPRPWNTLADPCIADVCVRFNPGAT